jgi:hypothetical protein
MVTAVTRIRCLVCFLRFIAICQLLAFIPIFIPVHAWLPGWYSWLRLGPAPDVSPVLQYAIGGTAYFQGAIGVWLWIMLSDVDRFRRLLAATAVIYLVAVPIFYYIDVTAGLPFWWRMYDCLWCLAVGAALLILCRQSPLHPTPAPAAETTNPRQPTHA